MSSRPFLSRHFARNTLAQLLLIHFCLPAYAPDSICRLLHRPDPISELFLAYHSVLKRTQGLCAVHSDPGKLLLLYQTEPSFGVTRAPSSTTEVAQVSPQIALQQSSNCPCSDTVKTQTGVARRLNGWKGLFKGLLTAGNTMRLRTLSTLFLISGLLGFFVKENKALLDSFFCQNMAIIQK